jgi:ABC-type multidrug transport system fused ATPase/permease subunit
LMMALAGGVMVVFSWKLSVRLQRLPFSAGLRSLGTKPSLAGAFIQLENIVVRTVGRRSKELVNVSVHSQPPILFPAHSVTAIMGQSGHGKTTLMRAACVRLDSDLEMTGSIRVDGEVVRPQDEAVFRAIVGYVPQDVSGVIENSLTVAGTQLHASPEQCRRALCGSSIGH